MKSKNIVLILVCGLMLHGASIYAQGSNETSYQNKLSQTFAKLCLQVDSGEISVEAAQASLGNLRAEYRIPFTDKAGVLNVLLYRIGAGELSADEAQSLFVNMNDSGTGIKEESGSQRDTNSKSPSEGTASGGGSSSNQSTNSEHKGGSAER